MSNPVYSVVIPAFQEELFIGSTLDKLFKFLETTGLLEKTEVIVVTANSSDRTSDIVRGRAARFPFFQFLEPGDKVGKGRDVRKGIMAARGQYILFTDADLATPLHHIKEAFSLLENGYDVVIGERHIAKAHSGLQKFVSVSANKVARLLIAPGVKDTQCGFKGFSKSAAQAIFSRLTILGWAFDMEVIAIAKQRGLSISSIEIKDWKENKPAQLQLAGESLLRAAIKSLDEAMQINFNLIRGHYKDKHPSSIYSEKGYSSVRTTVSKQTL